MTYFEWYAAYLLCILIVCRFHFMEILSIQTTTRPCRMCQLTQWAREEKTKNRGKRELRRQGNRKDKERRQVNTKGKRRRQQKMKRKGKQEVRRQQEAKENGRRQVKLLRIDKTHLGMWKLKKLQKTNLQTGCLRGEKVINGGEGKAARRKNVKELNIEEWKWTESTYRDGTNFWQRIKMRLIVCLFLFWKPLMLKDENRSKWCSFLSLKWALSRIISLSLNKHNIYLSHRKTSNNGLVLLTIAISVRQNC